MVGLDAEGKVVYCTVEAKRRVGSAARRRSAVVVVVVVVAMRVG